MSSITSKIYDYLFVKTPPEEVCYRCQNKIERGEWRHTVNLPGNTQAVYCETCAGTKYPEIVERHE